MAKDYNEGCIALAMFAPEMREQIVHFVSERGMLALQDVQECATKGIQIAPALSFFRGDSEFLINIARALRVIMGDCLAGQWTAHHYAVALARVGDVPMDYAERLAEDHIVTEDANVLSFMSRLLSQVPDLTGPFDDAIGSVLGGIIHGLEHIVPIDSRNHSGDVLWELNNLGEQMGRMARRASATALEIQYENAPIADSYAEAKDVAASTLPYIAKALLGVLGMKMEAGDINSGDRDEIGDLLMEYGDLIREGYYLPMEQGSIGSFLKRATRAVGKGIKAVGKAAAPLAQIAANAVIPGAGSAAGKLLSGGAKHGPSPAHTSAVHQAAAKAASYPPVELKQPKGGMKLTDLAKTVNDLRAAGVTIG